MRMGVRPHPGSARIAAQAAKPSISGIRASIRTRAGRTRSKAARASRPFEASSTSKPALCNDSRAMTRGIASSSTRSTSARARGADAVHRDLLLSSAKRAVTKTPAREV
jgi:hypothetical protein